MVSVCIVTYNSMKYLPYFLDSIFHQSYWRERGESPDIFIVDNASSDKTVEYIRTNFPAAHLLRNVNNIGLSRAWNQAIKMTHGEYLLIMNPDVILDEKFLSTLVKDMEDDAGLGSAGGKLYQLDFEKEGDYLIAPAKTTTLDSCGLLGYKSRRFVDRGAGEKDLSLFYNYLVFSKKHYIIIWFLYLFLNFSLYSHCSKLKIKIPKNRASIGLLILFSYG